MKTDGFIDIRYKFAYNEAEDCGYGRNFKGEC